MRGVRLGFVLFVVSTAAISGAVAQSSSVIIRPHPQSGTSPTPTTPLQVLDTEYPLEAILANEEGTTSLNLLIDPTGKVYFAQVLKSGGAARLDQAALRSQRRNGRSSRR